MKSYKTNNFFCIILGLYTGIMLSCAAVDDFAIDHTQFFDSSEDNIIAKQCVHAEEPA